MQRNILIPDTSAISALNIAFCLKKASPDCRVIGASVEKNTPAKFSRFFDKVYHIRKDYEVEDLVNLVLKENIDVLFPTAVRDIRLISNHALTFMSYCNIVPVPEQWQIDTATDKLKFYELLTENDIPVPETRILDLEALSDFNIQFPVMSKPRIGSGGIDIVRVEDRQVLNQLAADGSRLYGNYLLQEYIPGYDIDCSVLCHYGEIIAYTIQKDVSRPNKKSFEPAQSVEFMLNEEVLDLTQKVVGALRFNGIAHLDLRYDTGKNRYCVIEMNPRYWASLLGSYAAGINFPCLAVKSALKMEIDQLNYSACKFTRFSSWINHWPFGTTSLKDTNMKFILQDPMPRLMNKFAQKK